MVNKVTLIGNLGRDPEVRRLENGAVVAKFSVATTENYRDKSGEWQSQTEWHDVVAWRHLAERAETQLKKGAQVYVEGKLTHRSWEDQDGKKRYTTEVLANMFRLLGRREDQPGGSSSNFPSENDERSSSNAPAQHTSSAAKEEPPVSAEADDDLPF
jgi:single-strand DNA-binding protein